MEDENDRLGANPTGMAPARRLSTQIKRGQDSLEPSPKTAEQRWTERR